MKMTRMTIETFAILIFATIVSAASQSAYAQDRPVIEVESLDEALDILYRLRQTSEQRTWLSSVPTVMNPPVDSDDLIPMFGAGFVADLSPQARQSLMAADVTQLLQWRNAPAAALDAIAELLPPIDICIKFRFGELEVEMCVGSS